MDPNETLAAARAALSDLIPAIDRDDLQAIAGAADRLAENFMALDYWITRDGFLPDAWRRELRTVR